MNRHSRNVLVCALLIYCGRPVSAQQSPTAEQLDFFESRIRPILAEQCYECHNSGDTAEAGLILDHRSAMLRGGDSGSVFNFENPGDSLLLKVVRHQIDGLEMPEGGSRMSPNVIADLERWVAQRAPDPRDSPPTKEQLESATSWDAIRNKRMRWWSFQPIRPHKNLIHPGEHPIDTFIGRKLEIENLAPAPPADKLTLLRRVSFAIIGLPADSDTARVFLNDSSESAFATLVDRLLESPQFGERWARHWMDWIRYAESHGSEGDPRIENAWMYRDYLIRALNDDVPYDQLIREHVAGDLISQPRINKALQLNESMIATAHWRMVFHGFAPTDALDEKVRFTDDQIDAFSKAFLGLTVSCARCHDHKFDAISQKDYYALFGIFGSTRPGRSVASVVPELDSQLQSLDRLKDKIRESAGEDWLSAASDLQTTLQEKSNSPKSSSPLTDFLRIARSDGASNAWQYLRNHARQPQDENRFDAEQRWKFGDESNDWFGFGKGIEMGQRRAGDFMIAPEGDRLIERILPTAVVSGRISTRLGARLESPQIRLDGEHELWLHVAGGGNASYRYAVQNYPRNGTVYPIRRLGKKQNEWSWQKLDLSYWNGDDVHIELAAARDAPLLVSGEQRSWFGIREAVVVPKGGRPPASNQIDWAEKILSLREQPPEDFEDVVSVTIVAATTSIKRWKRCEADDADASLLQELLSLDIIPCTSDRLTRAAPLIAEYRRLEDRIPVPTRVPTLTEWKGGDQRLFVRGNHKMPAESVPRRFLEAIDSTPYTGSLSGRRQLAEDVLRPDNPFTKRVIVNRIWHHLFGVGIVNTPDNFGRLGAEPTHPELLDYLAHRFAAQDHWSLKSLIRLVVLSDTWQRSSHPSARALAKDPTNRWLSHAHVRRLEAEAIRDLLLSTSGQLTGAMYGTPVSGSSNRRSVYVSVVRNRLDPFLATFDAPVPFASKGRRDVTNVPAQALLMLNDPFVARASQQLGQSVRTDPRLATEAAKIDSLWHRCLGRQASHEERKSASVMLRDLNEHFRVAKLKRTEIEQGIISTKARIEETLAPIRRRLTDGPSSRPAETALPAPLAAWDFERSADDLQGPLNGQLKGTAKVENGALVLDGQGWMTTPPLAHSLKSRTFEATVLLSELAQRSGGVMTLQTTDGMRFDSIVFGERAPRRWMSGSDHHIRTQDVGGYDETSASDRPVHLAITYEATGTISIYRDGKLYGKPYSTSQQEFAAGKSEILFGMRHGTSLIPGRMFRGAILQARLYDRCLTGEEVQQASRSASDFVSDEVVLASMTAAQRNAIHGLREHLKSLQQDLNRIPPEPEPYQAWTDLAHAVFNLKEFIYVR